jgi:hypothetical protein
MFKRSVSTLWNLAIDGIQQRYGTDFMIRGFFRLQRGVIMDFSLVGDLIDYQINIKSFHLNEDVQMDG